jgi:hypothetical protein
MNLLRTKPLADCKTPQEALSELCSGFVACETVRFDCRPVKAEEVPEPFHKLLVHEQHMTLTLTAHYGAFLELSVKEMHFEENLYSRKISLTIPRNNAIVEYGLVRLDLRYIPEPVWKEIFQQRTPLGEILLRHNILQRIQPKWFLKFEPESSILAWMKAPQRAEPYYGRLGTIYCNGEPAVEVLEIVTGV